ncbi:hypothetical protein MMC30_008891 [Trapelia coarctata]|nr:hypothetical protein [Trapelia coarctata]
MLLFQHNNLKATEWMGVRRELATALRKLDETKGSTEEAAEGIKVQIIQTGIFTAALRVAEYFHPELLPPPPSEQHHHPFSRRPNLDDPSLQHGLSRTAHEAVKSKKLAHALTPLLSGPLAVVTFPTVSTAHLKTALSILAPNAPGFPAPSRRLNPGYHDPLVQAGLQKLMLLGARVEGRVFDMEGTRWVGSIEGGLEGLRGQLVALLQSFGAGVTNALEGAGKSLYITMESRRTMMEDEGKEGNQDKGGS